VLVKCSQLPLYALSLGRAVLGTVQLESLLPGITDLSAPIEVGVSVTEPSQGVSFVVEVIKI